MLGAQDGGGATATGWRIRLEFAAVVLATGLAAGLVLFHLGSRQIWIDEGDTFATASQHGLSLWHWALNDGGNMVAYYLGMHFWTEIFGTSEVALRLPSALAAIATVPVSYLLLRRLFDPLAGLLGAFFVAVSLPIVWWAQTARGYLLAVFFVTASTLFFVLAVETRRRAAYLAWVACSLLATYTILLSALVILVQVGTLPFRRRSDLEWRPLVGSSGAIAVLSVPLAAAVVIRGTAPVAWLPRPGPLFGQSNRYIVRVLASTRTVGVPINGLAHYLLLAMFAAWVLGAGLFVASIVRTGRSRTSWGYLLLIAWFVLPVALNYVISVAVHPVLSDRYILDSVPAASMLAAVACSRLRPWPLATAAGVVLVVMRSWVATPGIGSSLEEWRAAVQSVDTQAKPHDCIAFFVSDGFDSFDYYALRLPASAPPLPNPVLPSTTYSSRAPFVLDPAVIPSSQWAATVAACPRLWLVLSHEGHPTQPGPDAPRYATRVYAARIQLLSEVNASYQQTFQTAVPGSTITLFARRAGAAQ